MLVLYRTRNPFLYSARTSRSPNISAEGDGNDLSIGDENGGNIRGRIEDAYHDVPTPEIEGRVSGSQPEERGGNGSDSRGLVVQPSRLQNEGNEWSED